MSYDVSLVSDLGAGPVRVTAYEGNCTYNISPMVRAAIGQSINDWDGLQAAAAKAHAERVVTALETEVDRYEAMNPPNGWGSREGLIRFLREFIAACDEAPNATVRVW